MKLFSKSEVLQTVLTDGLRDRIMESSAGYEGAGRINRDVSNVLDELRSAMRTVIFHVFHENF